MTSNVTPINKKAKAKPEVLDLVAERNAAQERRSARSRKAAETRRRNQQAAEHRPYLLESSVVRSEIERHRNAALAEIEAVEADMLSIETRANNDIVAIRSRADAEIKARSARRDDLAAILEMTGKALGINDGRPADNTVLALELLQARTDGENDRG